MTPAGRLAAWRFLFDQGRGKGIGVRKATVREQRRGKAFVGVYLEPAAKRRLLAAAQVRQCTVSELVRSFAEGLDVRSNAESVAEKG